MENSEQYFENQEQVLPIGALSQEERVAFYRKTYTHVAGGILAFVILEAIFLQSELLKNFFYGIMASGISWIVLLVVFGFATSYVEGMALKTNDRNAQYAAYGAYIVLEALIFVPLLGLVVDFVPNSQELLTQAGIVTISLFAGLSAVVFFSKKDFSFLKTGLTVVFFIALGLIVAGALLGFDLGLWFSVGMIVFAAGCILYQTSQMKNKYTNEQYVPAAIGLFASFMLLLWYIIQLFLSRD